MLRDAGYETAISGKWHLGEFEPAYRPTQRGFDHQYGLWFGAIDYFTHLRDGDPRLAPRRPALQGRRLLHPPHRQGSLPDHPREESGQAALPLSALQCRARPASGAGRAIASPITNLKGVRRTYAGMVAAMDEAVGQVLAALG